MASIRTLIVLILFGVSFTARANTLVDLFNTLPGSKAVDVSEGKDMSSFLKQDACSDHAPWGVPDTKDKEVKNNLLYFCKATYTSVYDVTKKMPIFTLEILNTRNSKDMAIGEKLKDYKDAEELPRAFKQIYEDYKNSYYTLGHMASPENMFVSVKNLTDEQKAQKMEYAMKESFSMLNTVPMVGLNFKHGIWYELEMHTKMLAIQKEEVFVMTGPLFLNGKDYGKIGKAEIPVPTHFFKVIINPPVYGSLAYILPNKEIITKNTKKIVNKNNVHYCGSASAPRSCELSDFVVSIKEIEKHTGFLTYPRLSPYYAAKIKIDINAMKEHK